MIWTETCGSVRRRVSVLEVALIGAILTITAAVLAPVVAHARAASYSATGLAALKANVMAASLYSMDYDDDDTLPIASHALRGLVHKNAGGGGGHGKNGNGISYHGGPLILGTTHIYYIWYGNWSGNTATTILTDFANNIGGSPYYNINTTYYNGSNARVSNAVTYAGSTSVAYPYGTSLTDTAIRNVVADAINSNALPEDTNGVYFVLTSADVTASSGFCTSYCGWHTYTTVTGPSIKYSFVGNAARCPSACSMQTSPNGNLGADAMASIIAHELEEAVTDPQLNAWYDTRGYENADKCAWTFGSTYSSGGGTANMKLGSRDYLIQQNWVNASGGYCAKSY
jgi:hypothetical protein